MINCISIYFSLTKYKPEVLTLGAKFLYGSFFLCIMNERTPLSIPNFITPSLSLSFFFSLHYLASTVFPRSSEPFYIVTYYMKCVTTSWTNSMDSLFSKFKMIVSTFMVED